MVMRCWPSITSCRVTSPAIAGCGFVNDRAKEVLRSLRLGTCLLSDDIAFGDVHDVVQQRRPLVFFVPDIGTLEGRDLVVLLALEQITWAPWMCFHSSFTSVIAGRASLNRDLPGGETAMERNP